MSLGFPDVCATPTPAGPVPVPYPNIAMNAQASPFSPTVKVNMMNALNQMTQIALSSGDEAGSAQPTIKGSQRYTMGSPNVFVDGAPAITLASLTTHNNMNCPIGAVIVPSAVNVTFSRAAHFSGDMCDVRATRALDQAALRALGAEATGATQDDTQPTPGTVRIKHFGDSAGAELHAALDRLVRAGASSVEIDLSGCPGGSLEGALDAASVLLPAGTPLAELEDEDGDARVMRSHGGAFTTLQVALLVDARTASAAEVFAAALVENGRAPLRGGPTYGKGVVHRVHVSPDGDAALVRSGTVRGPSGRVIDGVGVSPR